MNTDELTHRLRMRQQLVARQRVLELRVASFGPRTPPEVVIELEEVGAELAQLDAQIAQLQEDSAPPTLRQEPPGQIAGLSKAELRRRILRHFDSERLELLCADINERLQQEGRSVHISPALVGGIGLELVIQRLIDYLDRCGQLALLVDTLRQEQPGIV